MAKYNINPSSSAPKSLVVSLAVPAPVVTGVTWPGSPKAQGAQCKTDISYRNDGGDGDMFLRVVKSDGFVLTTTTISAAAGETGTVSLYFNMPASDIVIYAQVGVSTTVTDQRGPRTIEILLIIGTSLSLALSPSSVEVGETVSFSGKLTRADAEPPGIQTIKLIDDVSGTLMATVSTNVDGNYSGTFTAPMIKGTYYYASEFGGVALAMYSLGSSSSAPRIVAVGINYLVNIGVPLVAAITMLLASLYSP